MTDLKWHGISRTVHWNLATGETSVESNRVGQRYMDVESRRKRVLTVERIEGEYAICTVVADGRPAKRTRVKERRLDAGKQYRKIE